MNVILYEKDHKDRAIDLADVETKCRRKTLALHVTTCPKEIPGLTTLVYFGHGTLLPKNMAENIRSWRENNAKLKTIELITCNATHTLKGVQAFVDKLNPLLKLGHKLVTRDKSQSFTSKCKWYYWCFERRTY